MRKANWGRKIIFITLAAILCTTAGLKAYAGDRNGKKAVSVKQAVLIRKPARPVWDEKELFGKQYTLKCLTDGKAGIYTNPADDRARDYVIDALNEAGIDRTMTDLDKITAINDYLCQKLEYADYAAAEGFSYEEDWLPFTDYCLLSDRAVCAGYAEAFQSMCISCGIECYYVTGYTYQGDGAEGIYHAWNRVVAGGKSYYIDTCWNDSAHNAYFLSADGWDDHVIDGEHKTYRISGQAFPMPAYMQD